MAARNLKAQANRTKETKEEEEEEEKNVHKNGK